MVRASPPSKQSSHRPPVNVTFAIDEEVEHAPPTMLGTIAFGLSFIPILGLSGAIIASVDILKSRRNHSPAHGLAYAAVALQAFYCVLALTLYLVVFQLPLVRNSSLNEPAVQTGQRFLSAIKSGDTNTLADTLDPSFVTAFQDSLPAYQETIKYNPQLVSAETIQKPQYSDSSLAAYNGRPASFQIWRVGTSQTTSHYYILTVANDAAAAWRVVGVISTDAGGESSARALAEQARISTFGR